MSRATPGFSWNADNLAVLRRMVRIEGKTFQAAARLLGVSKNAVIGKAHRLGISPADDVVTSRQANSRHAQEKRWAPSVSVAPTPDLFPAPGRCVYPFGYPHDKGFRFCGDKVAALGEPYCPDHHRLCWQPARAHAAITES